MAISVRSVYNDVCNSVLEPLGLTGQIITDAEFLRLLNDGLRDIIQVSNCFLKLNNLVASLGVRIYDHQYSINQVQNVLSGDSNVPQASGLYWDSSDYRWQQAGPGTPQEWRHDQLQEDQIEVRPSPAWNGYEPAFTGSLYGLFSDTSSPVTFDIAYDPASDGMYGTISKSDLGDVYVEFTAPMYGTIGSMVESTMNFTEITTYSFENEITSLDAYIPDFPDSFKPYVKFSVLSRAYAMDGELKNENLSKYYRKRLDEIIGILRSVSGEFLMSTA